MVNKFSIFLGILTFLIYGCCENVSDKKEYAEFIKGSWVFVKSDDPALDSCFNYFILFKDSSLAGINKLNVFKSRYIIRSDSILFDEQHEWKNEKRPLFMNTDTISHIGNFVIHSIDSSNMIFKNKLGYKYYFKNIDNKINGVKKIISFNFKIYGDFEYNDTTDLKYNYQIVKELLFRQLLDAKKMTGDRNHKYDLLIQERKINQDDFLRYENIINHYLSNEISDNDCSYGRLNIIPRIELNLIFDDKSDTTIIIRNIGNNPIKSGIIVYLDEINPFR